MTWTTSTDAEKGNPVHVTVGNRFIRWLDEIGVGDVALVSGKNASLGKMYRELTPKRVRDRNGFTVTVEAYRLFLREWDSTGNSVRSWRGWLSAT